MAGRGQDVQTVDARPWPGGSQNPGRVYWKDFKDCLILSLSPALLAQSVPQLCHTMEQSLGMGPKLLLTSEAAEFPFPNNYNGNSKN